MLDAPEPPPIGEIIAEIQAAIYRETGICGATEVGPFKQPIASVARSIALGRAHRPIWPR